MKLSKLNLQKKMLVSLGLFIFVFVGIALFFLRSIILGSFEDLERKKSIKSIERSRVVFDQQLSNLDALLSDWAIWDDTYKFFGDTNEEYVESNLNDESLDLLGLKSMIFVASSGAVLYEKNLDSSGSANINFRNEVMEKENIISSVNDDESITGVVKIDSKLYFVASRMVLKSDGSGPSVGSLIFVKEYDTALGEYFRRVNNNNRVLLIDLDSEFVSENQVLAKEMLMSGEEYFSSPISTDEISGYTLIYDIDNQPVSMLENVEQRDLYKQGLSSISNYILYSALVSVMGILFGLFLVNKFVLSRIEDINRNVNRVRDSNIPQDRLVVKGSDEFAYLSSNINNMLDEISKSKEEFEKFKLAVENSSEHTIITNPKGEILYANKAVERVTGYSQEEIIGRSPRIWGGAMPKEFYEKMWDTIKNKKTTFSGEIINIRKNGEKYIAEASITPILDVNNEVKFFVGLERDITHLKLEKELIEKQVKERTKQLNEEKAKLKASIDSLPLGFAMTDRNGNILSMNRIAKSSLCINFKNQSLGVFGKDSVAHLDCNIEEIQQRLTGTFDIKQAISNVVTTAKQYEVKELVLDGIYYHIFISPIVVMEEGQLNMLGSVILIENITERKILDRAKDEFFSIASHELRTPLTAIRGNTSLIMDYFKDKLGDPTLSSMIDDIHESSVRLIEIVNDFLDTSRLELGKMIYKNEPFSIVDVVQQTIKELGGIAEGKKIELKLVEPTSIMPNVYADSGKIKQVLVNLVGNSIKFTRTGSVAVSIEQMGQFIKVKVEDTGSGILPENQPLLFRKFQQANNDLYTRDSTQGTGLGLYISKLIVRESGGDIKLESSLIGKGSVFSFTLPIAKKNDVEIKN